MKSFREYIQEIKIRMADGTVKNVSCVPIRMASGKKECHAPGKSGSSGGGGD